MSMWRAAWCRRLAAALAAVTCLLAQAGDLVPGDYRFELDVSGRTRSYLVHVPPRTGAHPLPVVLSLHGGGGSAEWHRRSTGMDAAADRHGYLAIYPDGSGSLGDRLLTWNAGNCCAYAQLQGIDDVAFIARLIDDIGRRFPVDRRRIYVVGHSNGGMMAHRLGEALPETIAAIVSVAGAHVPTVSGGRAVPVLHIHSVDDPRALYAGGLGPPFPFTGSRVLHPSVDATLAGWVRRNGCTAAPTEEEYRQSGGHSARRIVYARCREGAEVSLRKLTGTGHGWPGTVSGREALVGPATTVIDANTEIWKFVSRFSLPP